MADPRKRPNLTQVERNNVAQWLLQFSTNGQLRRGAITEAANLFKICRRTVSYIWKEAHEQLSSGRPVMLVSKMKGVKHKDKMVLDEEKMRSLSVLERSTIRKLAGKLQVSKSLVGTWIKHKQIRAHTNAIKPTLSEKNKLARIKFSLNQLESECINGRIRFQTMYNTIHIDEKWFYMTKTSDRYYLLPDEEEPYRSCKSKRFITKVMFMSVVSRPIIGLDGQIIFDGKFGIFPFTKEEPALRNSKNRLKGTLETKPIKSVTRDVIKECIISQVIPAIKSKWPLTASKHIVIQQDNVKPHIKNTDPDFIAAGNSDGFHIQLISQPPNSPDTNVNDLGFFRAIQSLQDDKLASNVGDLLKNVITSYEELTPVTLNNVFLTLQGCYVEILKVKGGNNYKIPHMHKGRLIRSGTLPECIEVDDGLVRDCLDHLRLHSNDDETSCNLFTLEKAFESLAIN